MNIRLGDGYTAHEVFKEPRGLPPKTSKENAINLLEEAGPVNVRSYRYPHHHKNEIEKPVKGITSVRGDSA